MQSYRAFVFAALLILTSSTVSAQFGGSGGMGGGSFSSGSYSNKDWWWRGNRSDDAAVFDSKRLVATDSILNVITINGSAERRLVPEKMRLVVALTREGPTAVECRDALREDIALIRKDWATHLKIGEKDIVEDFVALLPVENWAKEVNGVRETQGTAGYRLQINLHVSLPSDVLAVQAIELAFLLANANVITFDYWHSKLDDLRKEVRALAVAEAKEKSDVMLAVFDQRPQIINIDEDTHVFYPNQLYQTYVNALETEDYWRNRDQPVPESISKFSFLRGLQSDTDSRSKEIMMKPEIVVASSVNLYYQSPAKSKVKTEE